MPLNAHAGEQHFQIERDHLLLRNRRVNGFLAAAAQLRRNRDEARQILLRDFHPGELLLSGFRITDHRRHIQAQVADKWERMGWVNGQGREHREDG